VNGTSGSSSLDRAVTSELSVMSRGQGDCRSSSVRMVRAYSFHGLKSRPNECNSITRLGSAAFAAAHASGHRSNAAIQKRQRRLLLVLIQETIVRPAQF